METSPSLILQSWMVVHPLVSLVLVDLLSEQHRISDMRITVHHSASLTARTRSLNLEISTSSQTWAIYDGQPIAMLSDFPVIGRGERHRTHLDPALRSRIGNIQWPTDGDFLN